MRSVAALALIFVLWMQPALGAVSITAFGQGVTTVRPGCISGAGGPACLSSNDVVTSADYIVTVLAGDGFLSLDRLVSFSARAPGNCGFEYCTVSETADGQLIVGSYARIFQQFGNFLFQGNIVNRSIVPGESGFALSITALPESKTWAMLLLGFGFVGGAMRLAKRRQKVAISYA